MKRENVHLSNIFCLWWITMMAFLLFDSLLFWDKSIKNGNRKKIHFGNVILSEADKLNRNLIYWNDKKKRRIATAFVRLILFLYKDLFLFWESFLLNTSPITPIHSDFLFCFVWAKIKFCCLFKFNHTY